MLLNTVETSHNEDRLFRFWNQMELKQLVVVNTTRWLLHRWYPNPSKKYQPIISSSSSWYSCYLLLLFRKWSQHFQSPAKSISISYHPHALVSKKLVVCVHINAFPVKSLLSSIVSSTQIFILPEYSSVILPFPTSSSMQILNIFSFSPEPFGRWEATVMANLGWEETRSGPVCLSRYMVMVMMMVMVILKSYRSWFGLSFCIIQWICITGVEGRVVQLAAGTLHSMALTDRGQVGLSQQIRNINLKTSS